MAGTADRRDFGGINATLDIAHLTGRLAHTTNRETLLLIIINSSRQYPIGWSTCPHQMVGTLNFKRAGLASYVARLLGEHLLLCTRSWRVKIFAVGTSPLWNRHGANYVVYLDSIGLIFCEMGGSMIQQ